MSCPVIPGTNLFSGAMTSRSTPDLLLERSQTTVTASRDGLSSEDTVKVRGVGPLVCLAHKGETRPLWTRAALQKGPDDQSIHGWRPVIHRRGRPKYLGVSAYTATAGRRESERLFPHCG